MKAIIKTGGKQYNVQVGDILDVELLDHQDTGKIIFENVLLISDGDAIQIGAPMLSGATVEADVVGDVKARKLIAYKYKRRHNCRVKKGHRQQHLRVLIKEIKGAA